MKTHKVVGGGGIQLHVDETGNPNGRPILFIHGFSQCRLAWNKQMKSDLADDFRLLAMDNRGHGLSEKPKDAYGDSQLWADDINAVITTLEIEQPLLSGWSYAGTNMCDYVRFYGEDQIGGFHFVGATSKLGQSALPFLGEDYIACYPDILSNDVEESMAALQRFVRLCVHEEPRPEDFYFFLGYNTVVPPYVRTGMRRTIENDDLLPKLRKPVLITHGEEDAIVLLQIAKHHAALISHAETSYYPNVGHATFWEDSERFNREIRAFASSL